MCGYTGRGWRSYNAVSLHPAYLCFRFGLKWLRVCHAVDCSRSRSQRDLIVLRLGRFRPRDFLLIWLPLA